MNKSYEMNMTEGAILPKLFLFAIPLILSSILQLLFNAADIIVVGRFSGSQALAAVGATTSLITLFVNLFLNVSIGSNVLTARYYGAKDEQQVREAVHTSITMAAIGGVIMIFVGVLASRPMLTLMRTPDDVIDQAVLYMSIYFVGMPALMVYNFGAAVLRAVGDTKRPLYFLTISGCVNVALNLMFVILLQLGVAGVALATILSQYLSAGFIVRCLCQTEGACHLELRNLHINKGMLLQILRIGGAAGFQSVMFNISNVLIQSSVNSFGSLVMAGNTAACNLESFIFVSMNSVTQTSLSFTSQNLGAEQYHRIDQIMVRCLVFSAAVGLLLGQGIYLLGHPLLGLYTSEPEVLQYGLFRLSIISTTYALCGVMDVLAGTIRGMGYSALPTVVSLLGACVFRIIWIFTFFRQQHTLFILYVSYPISWLLTAAAHFCCYLWVRRRVFPRTEAVRSQPHP
ncbi:MAG: MATE family efflux transporter [Butyricicoccaceae bacterium]